jgi:hypothetical protein
MASLLDIGPGEPSPDDIEGDALFSEDGLYRYRLRRWWAPTRGAVIYLGANPSTADAVEPDLTVKKLIGFTWRLERGLFAIVNMAGFVSTDPAGLLTAVDPVGPDNDRVITETLALYPDALVIACWSGSIDLRKGRAELRDRDKAVLALCAGRDVHCFGKTASGAPRHPSRLAYTTPLERWGT